MYNYYLGWWFNEASVTIRSSNLLVTKTNLKLENVFRQKHQQGQKFWLSSTAKISNSICNDSEGCQIFQFISAK